MRIKTLVENRACNPSLEARHGLCLYIETKNHKILFDLGPDDTFLTNASQMNVEIKDIDMVVLSHGHMDHVGGLKAFMQVNNRAKIYLSRNIFDAHLKIKDSVIKDIGLSRSLASDRFIFVEDDVSIDDTCRIFGQIKMEKQVIGDPYLFTMKDGELVQDPFDDELYLLVKEEGKTALFSGCSHKGIEQIVLAAMKRTNKKLFAVVGGFHFSHVHLNKEEHVQYLNKLGQKFERLGSPNFISGHCTGEEAYHLLKTHLLGKLSALKTGETFHL
mgnify:CR=1 FL=1